MSASIRNIFAIFFIRAGGAGFALLCSLITARILGAHGYGICAYALSWLTIISILARAGTDHLLVKEVGIFFSENEYSKIRGIYLWSNKIVLSTSLCFLLLATIGFKILHNWDLFLSLLIAFFMLPFLSLSGVAQSVLRGSQRVITALFPELILKTFLIIIVLTAAYFSGYQLTHYRVLWLHFFITALIFVLYHMTLNSKIFSNSVIYPTWNEGGLWIKSMIPFIVIDAANIMNIRADVVMIGLLQDVKSAGIYNVATNAADLTSFMLIAANMVIAPSVAALYSNGKLNELEKLLTNTARISFMAGLLFLGIMIFGGSYLLRLFGDKFVDGMAALIILGVGQVIRAATGSLGMLLVMSGNEKNAAKMLCITSLLNIIMNLLLIPQLGINGAAIATLISTVIWSSLLLIVIIRKIKINPTAF
jgi:O-antigen/teichoic acid export membrane protein